MKSQIINEHRAVCDKQVNLSFVFSKELREKYDEYMSTVSFLTFEDAANGIKEIYQIAANESEKKKAEIDLANKSYTLILTLCAFIAVVVLI